MIGFLTGTLTKKGGRGVALCALDGNRIVTRWESAALKEPNWILLNRARTRFFATCEKESGGCDFRGQVCEFSFDKDGMTVLAGSETRGDAPCHLSLSPDERFLYAANYLTGSVAVFPVENGLGSCVQLFNDAPAGCPFRAHAHQTAFMPDGRLLIADLGLDEVIVCAQDAATGLLKEAGRIQIKKATGPRHIALRDADSFYLVHELGGLVSFYRRINGAWSCASMLPSVPDGKPEHAAAAISFCADSARLYVSNRENNCLTEFRTDEGGTPRFSRVIPCAPFPRDFIILPDGRFLVLAQGSNDPAKAVLLGGIELLSAQGERLDFLPFPAAVCAALL